MSEINKWSYELQDFIKDNKITNLIINSCIEEENNCELKITIDNNNNLHILSDFNNYCYIESSLYETNELNLYVLFFNKYKSLKCLITSIIQYNFNNSNYDNTNIKYKYEDKYNFYNILEEKTKCKINFKELERINKNIKSVDKLLNITVPKHLLLNNNQIYQLITTEIKKINSNYNYNHIIEPIDNNIFSLNVTLFLQNINVIIKINLNNNLYPYYPPEIELIYPKVKFQLYIAVINLNITKIGIWNCALSLEWIITNLALKLNPIIDNYIDSEQSFNELENILLKLSNITKEYDTNNLSIDFDISTFSTSNNQNKKMWKIGTGYGSNTNKDEWNINKYIKEKEINQMETYKILTQINNLLNNNNFIFIKDSCLLRYIINITRDINLLEIENEHLIFDEIIKILQDIVLFDNFKTIINSEFINNIVKNLQPINDEIMLLFQNNEELQNNELYQGINNIFQTYSELIVHKDNDNNINITSKQELYCNKMKPMQFEMSDLLNSHKFYNKKNINLDTMVKKRIISEISSLKLGLPLNYDSSIWVRISKTNINLITFLISGPKDTPYENGLFLFDAYFSDNYPQVAPKVLLVTTGNKSVRFNPNLYNCGKVCLSLLGTWSGQQSEMWNPKTSTFLQVLISIQSLIFIDEPFFNEPGYESSINTQKGQISSKAYNNNIQYENIRWAMIDQINNPNPSYKEVIMNHFKLKKDDIINVIDKWILESDKNYNLLISKEAIILKELLNKL